MRDDGSVCSVRCRVQVGETVWAGVACERADDRASCRTGGAEDSHDRFRLTPPVPHSNTRLRRLRATAPLLAVADLFEKSAPCSRNHLRIPGWIYVEDNTVLGLDQQVDGEEPDRQRQLSAGKQRAGRERDLVLARVALEDLAGVQAAVLSTAAGEDLGPASLEECLGALLLAAVALEEAPETEAFLELDTVAFLLRSPLQSATCTLSSIAHGGRNSTVARTFSGLA